MPVRITPVLLVLAAALADRSGEHRLAFYALLGAVVATSVATLAAIGDAAVGRADRSQVVLWTAVLSLSVAGAAARAPVVAGGSVSTLARAALVTSLAVFCLQALVAMVAELRSRTSEFELLHPDAEPVLDVLRERRVRLHS